VAEKLTDAPWFTGFGVMERVETVGATLLTVHCAYSITSALPIENATPAAKGVPLPSAAVFHPANVEPCFVNVFATSGADNPDTIDWSAIVPLPPLLLNVILYNGFWLQSAYKITLLPPIRYGAASVYSTVVPVAEVVQPANTDPDFVNVFADSGAEIPNTIDWSAIVPFPPLLLKVILNDGFLSLIHI
jgi:hypothetical protein